MIIKVNNLGVVADCTIDSSKQLMVMCGPNSTGKTYVSYLLYALFSSYNPADGSYIKEISDSIVSNSGFELKKDYIDQYLEAESRAVKSSINSILGLSSDSNKGLFRYMKLGLEMPEDFFRKEILDKGFSMTFNTPNREIKFVKQSHSSEIRLEINGTDIHESPLDAALLNLLIFSLIRICAHDPITGARMLTVERNSIYTFNTELSLSRNELIDRLLEVKRSESQIFDMVNGGSKRYPLAIRDSLRVANDLENIQKGRSPFYDFASEIESGLLHGTIGVTKTGAVEFMPLTHGKSVKRLPVHMSSSIVKTLSSLIIYLKHLAKKDDLLIIDEPEMNLHPDNQRLLARIFARLVNKGLRMVVSTHSDYIIREFNNLVMAHELMATKKAGGSLSLPYGKSELIDRNKMEVLYFNFNRRGKVDVEHIPVDEVGFDVKSIDDTINMQNDITQMLFDTLKYGSAND